MRLSSNIFVDKNTPIYPSSNFTWGEATKNLTRPIQDLVIDGKLICSADEIEQKIIATAKYLDEVRDRLGGHPLFINSWYRPAHINRRVGGSKYSRHQYGDAVDFKSDYVHPHHVYKKLDAWHDCGGLGKYYNFTHIDLRGEKARWRG